MSEWRLVLNNSLSNQICAIHQGGVGWSKGMNIELYYDPDPSAAKLKIGLMQIRTGQLLYRDLPPDFPVTVELKIGNNTSGQIAMDRGTMEGRKRESVAVGTGGKHETAARQDDRILLLCGAYQYRFVP